MITPYYSDDSCTIYHGDCREIIPTLGNVDLILTDPPYFQVKDEDWDRQWQSADLFIDWLSGLSNLWKSKLAPNGSLYCFASPRMSARVELMLQSNFNVLNRIRWVKECGWHQKTEKEALRSFLSPHEEIIFAEHGNFLFEDIRRYLAEERDRAGFTTRRVAEEYQKKTGSRTVTGMAGHWFELVQWSIPTAENYNWLKNLFNLNGGDFLEREYEDLRHEYEDLRRHFNVTKEVHFSDVWNFDTVAPYAGKHECEKPQSMLRHIIEVSTKPGALVLDSFMGSGSTLLAARDCGRKAIGIEAQEKWCEHAAQKLSQSVFSFG